MQPHPTLARPPSSPTAWIAAKLRIPFTQHRVLMHTKFGHLSVRHSRAIVSALPRFLATTGLPFNVPPSCQFLPVSHANQLSSPRLTPTKTCANVHTAIAVHSGAVHCRSPVAWAHPLSLQNKPSFACFSSLRLLLSYTAFQRCSFPMYKFAIGYAHSFSRDSLSILTYSATSSWPSLAQLPRSPVPRRPM